MMSAGLERIGPAFEVVDEASDLEAMAASFPHLQYTNNQIKKAGEALRGKLDYNKRTVEVFNTAYNWRDSHALPMRRMRDELKAKIRSVQGRGITVARTKRMVSIRKKISRSTNTLLQIQDLGGCRAIVESMDQVRDLLAAYAERSMYDFVRSTSYIEQPKAGGYRSHHLIYKFRPYREDDEPFAGRRIEVQVRTRLQHAWATAVEAVGLVRGEDLKAGEGNSDWLRLFELMSSEFAEAEECPLAPGSPKQAERRAELAHLDRALDAVAQLESFNQAISYTEGYIARDARYFLIQYNNDARSVRVRAFSSPISGAREYSSDESNGHVSVLVEADKVEGLREAYPNYFLDVRLFTQNLAKSIAGGKLDILPSEQQESHPELDKPTTAPSRVHDLSWWFKHRGRPAGP